MRNFGEVAELGLPVPEYGMGLPFVPFTFPTILFSRLAESLGYPSITWRVADDVWAIYRDGRDAGEIEIVDGHVDGSAARDYLVARGVDRDIAARWLSTADEAARQWWGKGSYFRDFGAEGGIFGAVGGVVEGAATIVSRGVRSIVSGIGRGIGKGIGMPWWLILGFVLVLGMIAVFLVKKGFLVKKRLTV